MQGDINREVFPTFLAKKSHGWWITRRRMEIYTKISKRKDLVWSRQKQGKIRTTQGGVRIWKVLCEIFAQAWSSCLLKAIYSSFSSKSYTVWSVGFLTSRALKWYIVCKKWTSGSSPKVWKKTADATSWFFFTLLLFASLLCLTCLNDPKSCQNIKTSHKYD